MLRQAVTSAALPAIACAAPPPTNQRSTRRGADTTIAVGSGDSIHAVDRGIAQSRVLFFIPGLPDTWESYHEPAAALPDTAAHGGHGTHSTDLTRHALGAAEYGSGGVDGVLEPSLPVTA